MRELKLMKHFLKCIDDPSVDWREEKAKLEFAINLIERKDYSWITGEIISVLIGEEDEDAES